MTAVYLEGEVNSSDWNQLRKVCLDALKYSDHLVLNIRKVTGYDYSFSVLLCLLRRTAQLLRKRLTVKGKKAELFNCVHGKEQECSANGEGSCCLWESLFTRTELR